MCSYIAVLDNDEAGKNASHDVQQQLGIGSERFRYFKVNPRPSSQSELEDLYDPNAYRVLLMDKFGIDISMPTFRDKRKKWCTRIEEIAASSGRELSVTEMSNIKKCLSEAAREGDVEAWFSERGIELLDNICKTIKTEVMCLFSPQ